MTELQHSIPHSIDIRWSNSIFFDELLQMRFHNIENNTQQFTDNHQLTIECHATERSSYEAICFTSKIELPSQLSFIFSLHHRAPSTPTERQPSRPGPRLSHPGHRHLAHPKLRSPECSSICQTGSHRQQPFIVTIILVDPKAGRMVFRLCGSVRGATPVVGPYPQLLASGPVFDLRTSAVRTVAVDGGLSGQLDGSHIFTAVCGLSTGTPFSVSRMGDQLRGLGASAGLPSGGQLGVGSPAETCCNLLRMGVEQPQRDGVLGKGSERR